MGLTIFGVAAKKVFLSVGEGHVEGKYIALFCTAIIIYGLALALIDIALTRQDEELSTNSRALLRLGMVLAFVVLIFFREQVSPLTFIIAAAAIVLLQVAVELRAHPQRQEGSGEG